MGQVEVELLGVAGLLARRPSISLAVDQPTALRPFVHRLAEELPALVGTVVDAQGGFLGGYVLSRDGIELLRDPDAPIAPGDRLLLLSLSAGG